MISGHQFRFGFRQIEGGAVSFGVGGDQINDKAYGLKKDIPVQMALRIHDIAQAKAARHNKDAHER